ncbi:MAG: CARDB domain-containing protein [SAR324 cluster bacterium]|nr:CARDB domain-containing protein [SAR324 cluster bacterium]
MSASFRPSIFCLFLLILLLAMPAQAQRRTDFELGQVVLSRNCPLPDGPDLTLKSPEAILKSVENPDCPHFNTVQLIQASVTNLSSEVQAVGVEVVVKLDGEQKRKKSLRKQVMIPPFDLMRLLHDIKLDEVGVYRISVRVWTDKFRQVLVETKPGDERRFYIASEQDISLARDALGTSTGGGIMRKLEFEPPDLRWESAQVIPKHILRGETMRLRLNLLNVGGDIIRNVRSKVEIFNTRQPRRRTVVATPVTPVMAPGEVVTYELEYVLPEDQLLGTYQISATADPDNVLKEVKENNNEIKSDDLKLSDIKLLLPPEDFMFEENGLFLFQWDSLAYGEFKIQVGVDKKFEDAGAYFDLPQGDRWIADKELVPLSGELPGMAMGLMESCEHNKQHRRVVGRQARGRQAISEVRSFTIKPAKPEG